MSDEKLNSNNPANETDYQAPAIEEVVSREAIEREVAYAGVVGGTVNIN